MTHHFGPHLISTHQCFLFSLESIMFVDYRKRDLGRGGGTLFQRRIGPHLNVEKGRLLEQIDFYKIYVGGKDFAK